MRLYDTRADAALRFAVAAELRDHALQFRLAVR
jgi:hypothetical protein